MLVSGQWPGDRPHRVGVIGAVGTGGASLQTQACAPVQHNEEHRPPGHTKASAGLAEKKPRSHSTVKPTTPTDHVTNQRSNSDVFSQSKKAPRHLYMSTSDESPIGGAELNREPVKPSPPVRTSQPFTDIFGTPIKAKHSPDPSAKAKDSVHSSQQKSNKISPGGTPSSSAGSKEPKAVFKESHPLDPKESKQLKPQKPDKEIKLAVKRASPSPIQSVNLGLDKKRRRSSLSSEGNDRSNDVPKAKVKDGKEKKERHKSKVPSGANVSKKEKDKSKPRVLLPPIENKDTTKSPKASNQVTKIVSPVPEPCVQELETNGVNDAINKSHDSSPASSISLSSLPSGGAHGPLAAMMAEMENELLSPLSSDPGNSPQQLKDKQLQNSDNEVANVHVSEDKPVLKPTVKTERKLKQKSEGKSKFTKSSKTIENCANLENNHHDPPIDEKDVKQNKGNHIDPAYLRELVDLQRKIMGLSDRHLLQRIVDVIEETGRYQVTNSTFDFDLCTLDQSTVRKLKNCLTVK